MTLKSTAAAGSRIFEFVQSIIWLDRLDLPRKHDRSRSTCLEAATITYVSIQSFIHTRIANRLDSSRLEWHILGIFRGT
eukprot:SAG31_NODE_3266_length_4472_cov_4.101142_5_plen_79_part_00